MRDDRRGAFLPILAALAGLASPGPIAAAASLGPDGLPPLHGRAQLHVPALPDAGLIKLYRSDQFAPILRDPGIERQLAAALAGARAADPARFDRREPRLGHLLRDPAFFHAVLAAYLAHPARFTSYHHRLVPFLRGAAMLAGAPGPTPPSASVPIRGTTAGPAAVGPMPGGVSDAGGGPRDIPPGNPCPQPVPAPPSFVLLIAGVGLVAARLRSRDAATTA